MHHTGVAVTAGDTGSGRPSHGRLFLVLAGVALAAVILWLTIEWVTLLSRPPGIDSDFGLFYAAADAMWHSEEIYRPANGMALLPPHALFCLQPLLLFSPDVSAWLWFAVNVVALYAMARVISSELAWRPTAVEGLAIVASPVFIVSAVLGQCAWLLALLTALGWRDLRRANNIRAGVWFALVTTVKPFLLPLGLLFFWRRRIRALITWMLTGLAVLSIGVWLCGVHRYIEWMAGERFISWYDHPANASLLSIAARLASSAHRTLHDLPPLGVMPVIAAAAIVTVLSCWRLNDREQVDRDLAITVLAILLIFPLGWIYYVLLAAGPLTALWKRRAGTRAFHLLPLLPLWWPAGVGWWAHAKAADFWQRLAPDCFYAIGLLLLWILVLFTERQAGSMKAAEDISNRQSLVQEVKALGTYGS